MIYRSIVKKVVQWLAVALLLGFSFAMAQSEPTLNQVYATAQAGKLDEAQVMIRQVLVNHPKSGKAHFVQAELFARQGKLDLARESLATAEKLSPGLPFAKSETIQALRLQLSGKTNSKPLSSPATNYAASVAPVTPASASFSWGLPLLLAGGVIVVGYLLFRRKAAAPVAQQAGYVNQGGLNGPQSFGMGGAGVAPPGYPPQPTSPPPGYPPQAGSGMGGRIMGGVATGLAVGAGVMAAEAIGRNLMGNHNPTTGQSSNLGHNDSPPLIDSNPDMGGSNFGVDDTNSWDDGGGSEAGGGSDWDT